MAMHPADCGVVQRPQGTAPSSGLEKLLRLLSVVTMAMTVPQVWTIWVEEEAAGISLISWASYLFTACLWFVYGLRKRDKTIYLACIGWILLDAAVVAGVVVHA